MSESDRDIKILKAAYLDAQRTLESDLAAACNDATSADGAAIARLEREVCARMDRIAVSLERLTAYLVSAIR